LRPWAGLGALAALGLAGPAIAQDIPRCPLVPPVEEIEVQKLPAALRGALARDVGPIAVPGAAFDATEEVKVGVNHRLIWVRKQGSRWVVALEEGGRNYHDVIVAYELGYDGSIAGVRKETAFPATVCELTERDLWR
jgi:hypothetical protein